MFGPVFFSCFGKHFQYLTVIFSEVINMKKAVLAFICSMILMGGFGALTLPEKEEPAVEQNSYAMLSNFDTDSMPKIIYVV